MRGGGGDLIEGDRRGRGFCQHPREATLVAVAVVTALLVDRDKTELQAARHICRRAKFGSQTPAGFQGSEVTDVSRKKAVVGQNLHGLTKVYRFILQISSSTHICRIIFYSQEFISLP